MKKGIYKHSCGESLHKLLGVAMDIETGRKMVVFRDLRSKDLYVQREDLFQHRFKFCGERMDDHG